MKSPKSCFAHIGQPSIRNILGFLLMLSLLVSLFPTVSYAASSSQQDKVTEIIEDCGDTYKVVHPNKSDILDKFETKYVKSGKGHSIYSFWDSEGENKRPHTVLEGTEVTVLAEHDGMSFCYYESSKGTEKVGWLGSQWLVDEYEGAASKKVDSKAKQEMYDIIEDCGDSKNVVYPNDSDILDKFETKYVKSGKGHSIYSFWDPDGENKRPHTVLEKTEVTVMAEYDGMSFCFYESSKGTEKVGWLGSQWLVDKY